MISWPRSACARARRANDLYVTRDVKALWDMGYFADVEVAAKRGTGGVVITFRVKERPRSAK